MFTSYAHEDEQYREALRRHLSAMQHAGLLEQWSDHDIRAGQEWSRELLTKLEDAHLIVLLISSDFLASNYCWQEELTRALERQQVGEAHVIPVLVRSTDWADTPLARLQAVPPGGTPVSLWPDQDQAWTSVAEEIRRVVESLRRQVSAAALDKRWARWPRPRSPLLGREAESAELRRLLSGSARLITIVGPPGVGKTDLAEQVCPDLAPVFPDGGCRVPLAHVTEASLVASEIARVLRVEEGNRPVPERLEEVLGDREFLLLLDGFQQLGPATSLVCRLLDACPGLKVLVTSREALSVRGERVLCVDPLPVPSLSSRSLDDIAANPAVELFVHKAGDSGRHFQLTSENASDVAELCRRLDGLPLAMELAAGHVRLLSPRDMLACLPDLMEPMAEAVGLSVGLLNAEEQQLFARLAVFSDGCSFSSAREVCGGSSVFRQLKRLLTVSLLYTRSEAGDNRWTMLQPVREQAMALLEETGDHRELLIRHAEHYRRLGEVAEQGVESADQRRSIELLTAEHANCRAVLQRALEGEVPAEEGLRLAGALGPIWYVRGSFTEGRHWLERLLALKQPVRSAVRAKALVLLGIMTYHQCDYPLAEQHLEDGRQLFQQLDEDPETSLLLVELGFSSRDEGVAKALNCQAFVSKEQGDHDKSVRLYEESLRLYREVQDEWGIPWTATDLALALLSQDLGNAERAVTLLEESLERQARSGQPSGHALTHLYLAYARKTQGRDDEATRLAGASLERSRELGYGRGIALAAHFLGLLHHAAGRHDQAVDLLWESLRQRHEQGDKVGTAECVDGLAAAHHGIGELEFAGRLLGLAEALWEQVGGGRREHPEYASVASTVEHDLMRLRGPISESARAAGRLLTVRQLLQEGGETRGRGPGTGHDR